MTKMGSQEIDMIFKGKGEAYEHILQHEFQTILSKNNFVPKKDNPDIVEVTQKKPIIH